MPCWSLLTAGAARPPPPHSRPPLPRCCYRHLPQRGRWRPLAGAVVAVVASLLEAGRRSLARICMHAAGKRFQGWRNAAHICMRAAGMRFQGWRNAARTRGFGAGRQAVGAGKGGGTGRYGKGHSLHRRRGRGGTQDHVHEQLSRRGRRGGGGFPMCFPCSSCFFSSYASTAFTA